MIDLHPAARRVADRITGLDDDQLMLPTPCGSAVVGDVVDHLGMFASNFARVARKELDEANSSPPGTFDVRNLEPGWRDRLARQLQELADAWSAEEAWQGNTWVAGMRLPAEVVGVIALDELVIHGWDVSVATGQPFVAPADEIRAAADFVAGFDAPRDGQLFGPVVDVAPDASELDRLLGLTGRDPGWQPSD